MESLPKKILVIRDCTFILPDDFEGTTEDAFAEFLEYQKENSDKASYGDSFGLFSTFNMLMYLVENARVCGEYAILTLNDEGKYILDEQKPKKTKDLGYDFGSYGKAEEK